MVGFIVGRHDESCGTLENGALDNEEVGKAVGLEEVGGFTVKTMVKAVVGLLEVSCVGAADLLVADKS